MSTQFDGKRFYHISEDYSVPDNVIHWGTDWFDPKIVYGPEGAIYDYRHLPTTELTNALAMPYERVMPKVKKLLLEWMK